MGASTSQPGRCIGATICTNRNDDFDIALLPLTKDFFPTADCAQFRQLHSVYATYPKVVASYGKNRAARCSLEEYYRIHVETVEALLKFQRSDPNAQPIPIPVAIAVSLNRADWEIVGYFGMRCFTTLNPAQVLPPIDDCLVGGFFHASKKRLPTHVFRLACRLFQDSLAGASEEASMPYMSCIKFETDADNSALLGMLRELAFLVEKTVDDEVSLQSCIRPIAKRLSGDGREKLHFKIENTSNSSSELIQVISGVAKEVHALSLESLPPSLLSYLNDASGTLSAKCLWVPTMHGLPPVQSSPAGTDLLSRFLSKTTHADPVTKKKVVSYRCVAGSSSAAGEPDDDLNGTSPRRPFVSS